MAGNLFMAKEVERVSPRVGLSAEVLRLLLLALMVTTIAWADEPLHRRADDRPAINVAKVQKLGIRRYDSERLMLFADLPEKQSRELVGLVDQVWPLWEAQLGSVPPARNGLKFQLTGYVMLDPAVFAAAGLVDRAPTKIHGVHKNYEFWMDDQPWDYYRRHLLLHEATHCVMMCGEDTDNPPVWFLEGMAEYFGTHELTPEFRVGVIPASAEGAHGFGRIEMLRQECLAGRGLTSQQVARLGSREFGESRTTPYAWSWAFCTFLARHPETRDEFRTLCRERNGSRFAVAFERLRAAHPLVFGPEWELFREELCYGYDLERHVVPFTTGKPVIEQATCDVEAARGWQSSGIRIEAGQAIELTATGRVTLAQTTKPWVSEPLGISIRYAQGQPIGRLRGAILRTIPAPDQRVSHWEFFDVGATTHLIVPASGTVYFRVNDRDDDIANNEGTYQVRVHASKP